MKGWMYILECNDGSYYTGSTNNLELRLQEHSNGEGANHTKKRLPVKLIYFIVIRNSDTKIIKKDTIAGEEIHWKDGVTLSVTPYKEVEKLQTLEAEPIMNEILIKI